MKIIILGAGIAGVSAAYFLAESGHEVHVVDREASSAMQTSFANGGQLSYSHAEPWANPGVLKKALPWVFKNDAPLLFRPKLDWHTLSWLTKFLGQCTEKKAIANTINTLRLGLYSRDVLNELAERTKVEFHYRHKGIAHIFKSQKSFDAGIEQAEFQVQHGAPYQTLTPEQCIELEPALKHIAPTLCGAVYYPDDESGDIHLFTQELAEMEDTSGRVKFHYGTRVQYLHREGNKITGVQTSKGKMEGDIYVMAMGSYSYLHLRDIKINVPMYPMKGYSISVPVGDSVTEAPTVSITDQSEKIVYSRLGNILRAAGTAEFAGFNTEINRKRVRMLKRNVEKLFPNCGDLSQATEWACLRPQMPDGGALIGKCKYENLILNTGHGSLGWTLGPGSSKIVADIIDGKEPEISLDGLTIDRFSY